MKTVNLEIYGFDSNSSKVFNYLLKNVGNYRSVTAKLISDNLEMPLKAVYQSLKQLEKEGLVESNELDYPKLFSVQNPAYTLSQLADGQIEKHEEKIRTIQTELEKAKSSYLNQFFEGSCKRQITFYHFTNNSSKAKEFIINQIKNATIEILISLIPRCILVEVPDFVNSLNTAADEGIWSGIYLSKDDLDIIAELNDQVKAFIVDSPVPNYCSVDNRIFVEGHILVDRKRLISISYDPQGNDWILSSFIDFKTVEALKGVIRSSSLRDARDKLNEQPKEL